MAVFDISSLSAKILFSDFSKIVQKKILLYNWLTLYSNALCEQTRLTLE